MDLLSLLVAITAMNIVSAQEYRYKNPRSTPYLIDALPDVEFDVQELYGGSVAINESDPSRTLYFMFKPGQGKASDSKDLTIWLDGGPGCSSLGTFFLQNGPVLWQPGICKPQRNPYTWSKYTNVLWVDNPAGAGFSEGKRTLRNERDVAREFLGFLQNWEEIFGIEDYRIFITGESYAGRYIPYISAAMLEAKDKRSFDLKGILMYSPTIANSGSTQRNIPRYPFIQHNNNIINLPPKKMAKLERLHVECGYAEYLEKYLQFPPSGVQPVLEYPKIGGKCDLYASSTFESLKVNFNFNPNHITDNYPRLDYSIVPFPLGNPPTPYFNRDDVVEAIHAPGNVTWEACHSPLGPSTFKGPHIDGFFGDPDGKGPLRNNDRSRNPIELVLPQVIEATNRVLISSGDYDGNLITNGTLLNIQNMTWGGQMGFQEAPSAEFVVTIKDHYSGLPQGVMGKKHYERGLMWVQTNQAGHEQPASQPRAALMHLRWMLGQLDDLGE